MITGQVEHNFKLRVPEIKLKILATAKVVGVLPPEAPQWPNSSSGVVPRQVPGVVPRHVPGVVPIMFRGMSVLSTKPLKASPNTTESGL